MQSKMARILKMFLVLLLLTMVINVTKGLPHRWHSDVENPSTNVSNNDSGYGMKSSPDHGYTLRKILSKGSYAINGDDVPSRSDGKIIFPSDDIDPLPSRSRFVPSLRPICENLTFCEHPVNYPNDFVEAALRMNKEIKFYSGADLVPDIVHRVNTPAEDTPLCESYEKVVYPKVAQSKDKEWLFVVNQGDFTQGVRVETCGKENNACNVIDGFAEGYKTSCKQKYIYRQLVAVSPVGEIKPEMFRFPASCCCHIKFTANPLLRIGASKKSGLAMSKVQRRK